MYLTYANFKVLFKNCSDTIETDYDILEAYAEDLIESYLGKKPSGSKTVGYAIGLTVQYMIAVGILPKNLSPISAGGINSSPSRDFLNYIPDQAKDILNRFRELSIG